MAVRYVSRPRRRSAVLSADVPTFTAVGVGAASSPVFEGLLLADLPLFIVTGSGSFIGSGGSGMFTPTHYVAANATGSGDGSSANPYTLLQACSLAQPGWRVLVRAGIYIGINTNTAHTASFRIATNGTQANPIIFFAENYASLNETGRSILQHNGTQQGSGCPVLGAGIGHHWYGFYINEDQAPSRGDTGPVVCHGAHSRFCYMRINRGQFSWPDGQHNHAAIRFEGTCQHNVISDCLIENYSSSNEQASLVFSPSNSEDPAIAAGLITVENCLFVNNRFAFTVKGDGTGRPILGGMTFRKNLVLGVSGRSGSVEFMDTRAALGNNVVYQNVQSSGSCLVQCTLQSQGPTQNIYVINNTLINNGNSGDSMGVLSDYFSAASGSGWRMHNNIKQSASRIFIFPYSADTAMSQRSHNLSFGHSQWGTADNRPGVTSLVQWVANTTFDDNSWEVDPELVSTTWGNAGLGKLGANSPARNTGIDVLNLLGGGTSAPINLGAFITSDMSDVLGIRPLT